MRPPPPVVPGRSGEAAQGKGTQAPLVVRVALRLPLAWIPFPALRAAGDDTGEGCVREGAEEAPLVAKGLNSRARPPHKPRSPSRVIPGWSRAAAEGKGILPLRQRSETARSPLCSISPSLGSPSRPFGPPGMTPGEECRAAGVTRGEGCRAAGVTRGEEFEPPGRTPEADARSRPVSNRLVSG